MKILVLAVGRARGAYCDLWQDYARRLTWECALKEFELKHATQEQEAEALLQAVPAGARVIVCDERGKNMGSETFAHHLGRWQDDGIKQVVFLLGGADGHTDQLRARADLLISFGCMTWPHMLARVMLIEQIYRAQQILANHPYHRA